MTFLYHTSAVDSTGAELNPSCATQTKCPLTLEQNMPGQCLQDAALGYVVHCYCQLTEKNIPITDWVPIASLLTFPGFACAQKASLSLERPCARQGLSRERSSVCRRQKTIPRRAGQEKTMQVCSALGPIYLNVLPSPELKE